MTIPQTATKQTNEAALCRAIRNEADWELILQECGLRPQTILYHKTRQIGVQLTGLLHRGRIWMHNCPTHWKSKHSLREADQWVQRHAHIDLTGLPETG